MTSINALLAELDCLTGKIAKLGQTGNALPDNQKAAYRKTSHGEYMKLRTIFRIRRAELVRLLGEVQCTGTDAHSNQHNNHNNQCNSESDSFSEEYNSNPPARTHTPKRPQPPIHVPAQESASSLSSSSEDPSYCDTSDTASKNCRVYSPSEDPLIEDDNGDLFCKMGDVLKKFIGDSVKRPQPQNACSSESEYDTDAPSVFSESEPDNNNYIVNSIETIRKRIENHMTGNGTGNFDIIRNLMKDVSKFREAGVGKDTINSHLNRIVKELDNIEQSCR